LVVKPILSKKFNSRERKVTLGLKTSFLLNDVINNINDEYELRQFVENENEIVNEGENEIVNKSENENILEQ